MEEGWCYRKITEYLDVNERKHISIWVMKYRAKGEVTFQDRLARKQSETELLRKQENEVEGSSKAHLSEQLELLLTWEVVMNHG